MQPAAPPTGHLPRAMAGFKRPRDESGAATVPTLSLTHRSALAPASSAGNIGAASAAFSSKGGVKAPRLDKPAPVNLGLAGGLSFPSAAAAAGRESTASVASVDSAAGKAASLSLGANITKYYSRARKLCNDEMLDPRNNKGANKEENLRALMYRKQSHIMYLEDVIKAGPGGEAVVAALAADAGRFSDMARQLKDKDASITELTTEKTALIAERAARERIVREALAAQESAVKRADEASEDKARLQEKVNELKVAYAREVEALKGAHAREVAARETEGRDAVERETAKVKREAEAERARLTKDYTGQINTLQAKVTALTSELEALRAKAASEGEHLRSALAASAAREADLTARFERADARRLKLQEEVLSMKGAIRVFARVRPPLPHEAAALEAARASSERAGRAFELPLQFPDAKEDATQLELVEPPGAGIGGYGSAAVGRRSAFQFQRVFPPLSTNAALFEEVEPLVQSTLDGHRVCIFAYGQTGAGKTYTMEGGPGEHRGLIPRSVDYVFSRLALMRGKGWDARVTVDMVEIYNENLRDLLAGSSTAAGRRLEIRQDEATRTTRVEGLSSHPVSDPSHIEALLAVAARNRATGATNSNATSSRSHSVFTIRVELLHRASAQHRKGLLHLIDLAGSERIAKSGVNDAAAGGSAQLLKETQAINKSLSALSKVIMELMQHKAHVSYRDSELTRLLQFSLGGECKTLMLANLNPLPDAVSETLSTLRFASSVACVNNAGGATAGGRLSGEGVAAAAAAAQAAGYAHVAAAPAPVAFEVPSHHVPMATGFGGGMTSPPASHTAAVGAPMGGFFPPPPAPPTPSRTGGFGGVGARPAPAGAAASARAGGFGAASAARAASASRTATAGGMTARVGGAGAGTGAPTLASARAASARPAVVHSNNPNFNAPPLRNRLAGGAGRAMQ